ncbi:ATP-binding cassette domain-containing protein [Aurantivibrio plasticivorans]
MSLLRLSDIHLAFGTHVILDHIELVIQPKQKIGLLGRNGAGKSTFLKLLAGEIKADSGEYWQSPSCKIAYLDQSLPEARDITIYDYVAEGLGDLGGLLQEFHHLAQEATEESLIQLERVQQKIEAANGWMFQQRIESTLSQLNLPADTKLATLSGGWRRRASLAKALVSQPDILLLDEPTNHLDIPTIQWLENLLNEFQGTIIVITHDRSFLQNIATEIFELDRGELRTWQGDYQGFLRFREQQLAAEEKTNSEFDKKLAKEEQWIRQGIKARRTRNEGRVRALKEMRKERQARRETQGTANMQLEQASKSGKIVVEADNISKRYDDKTVVPPFSTLIQRGDRIGIVGANGAGKTTLLKCLLGQLEPDTGSVKLGTKLEVAYFDQLRSQLDLEKSVIDNIAEGREFITINGVQRHVISYLQDFLFTPDRTRQPVKALSGGEQNRLILAYLFSKPSNLLVLDEPTNDLDMETLELLEDLLINYQGTLLLVSHDRAFIDNVVTSVIVFEADGELQEYVGGYTDWEDHGGKLVDLSPKPKKAAPEAKPEAASKAQPKKKLSYKVQRELEELPNKIEAAETLIEELSAKTSEAGFYDQPADTVNETMQQLADTQAKLDALYQRWEEIENEL